MASYVNKVCCTYHPEAELYEDYHAGDQICSECGLVVGDRTIDVGAEWRTFSNENNYTESTDHNRVGASENSLFNGDQLTTRIGRATGAAGDGTAKYRNTSSTASSRLPSVAPKRARPGAFDEDDAVDHALNKKRQKITEDDLLPSQQRKRKPNQTDEEQLMKERKLASDKQLKLGYDELDEMCNKLHIVEGVKYRAKRLFKEVEDTWIIPGRTRTAKVASCIYIACRQENCPRTFLEVTAVTNNSKKEIGRAFKEIVKLLQITIDTITSGDFLSRFCAKLDLPKAVPRVASKMTKKAFDLNIVHGRSPISVATAAIYIAAKELGVHRTLENIGIACGIADVTIRQSRDQLLKYRGRIMPENMKEERESVSREKRLAGT